MQKNTKMQKIPWNSVRNFALCKQEPHLIHSSYRLAQFLDYEKKTCQWAEVSLIIKRNFTIHFALEGRMVHPVEGLSIYSIPVEFQKV
jgi:hypothetical protein